MLTKIWYLSLCLAHMSLHNFKACQVVNGNGSHLPGYEYSVFLSTQICFHPQLLKKDENGQINKSALLACKQIVDCLVENVLRIEEKGVGKLIAKMCFD